MSRQFLSKFMYLLGLLILIVPSVLMYFASSAVDPESEIDPATAIASGLIVMAVPAIVAFLNAHKWTADIKYNKKGVAKTKLHFWITTLLMYALCLIFGLTLTMVGGTVLTGGNLGGIAILAVMGLITLVPVYIIRSAMREDETIEYMEWDADKVYRRTSWWFLLLMVLLPSIIIIALILIMIYIGLSIWSSSNSPSYCPDCGRSLDSSGYCSYCHKKFV